MKTKSKTKNPRPLRLAEAPMLLNGLARVHAADIVAGRASRRVLITGPAGSGKSRLIQHLRFALEAAGEETAMVHPRLDVRAVAPDVVLLVDDAHLLDAAQLAHLAERCTDPDAGIVVAARPTVHGGALHELAAELERSQPAIVLGTIGRIDLRTYLAQMDETLSDPCCDALLAATAGTAWLLSEALAVHESTGCSGDGVHVALHESLRDVVAHRIRALDAPVRAYVETICLSTEDAGHDIAPDLVLAAYSDGLVLVDGRPAPLVRETVRSVASIADVVHLLEAGSPLDDGQDATVDRLIHGPHGRRIADLLIRQGDTVADADPRRARALYRQAREAGADPATAAIREARAEWQLGGLDAASRLLDGAVIPADHPDHDAAADTAAAIWAARGHLSMSDAVYRTFTPSSATSQTGSVISAFAVADRERVEATGTNPGAMPSTLEVSMHLLAQGLRATLESSPHDALNDLVRASETYTAAGARAPLPELPAVIAAQAALHIGEPEVAFTVLDRALDGEAGTTWATDRLVLWRAWVSLQLERAHDAERVLEEIAPRAHRLSPRERMLFDAVSVSLARRYHDAVAVTTAWRAARESIMRASFDLFGILPLAEFVTTAARVREPERVSSHFDRMLQQLERIGSPSLWSPIAHWAGIQRAILLGRPADMQPHARALLHAAPHSRPAAVMAQAGKVWTQVLAGSVDPDAVEESALALGAIGLAWDGARLAGHGAGHTTDRRVSARLLATARRLHPHEDIRPTSVESTTAAPPRARTHSDLSPREREVAVLVVQGKTYTEIGATIFISPRTAEHHIARIRRRLGATNRSDLIAKLRVALDDAEAGDEAGEGTRVSA